MRKKRLTALLRRLAAVLVALPLTASAGLLGSSVVGTPYYPSLYNLGGTGQPAGPFTVDDQIEFPEGLILYSGDIDITDKQILWIPTVTMTYDVTPFNGFGLKFSGAPPITNVVLNPASALSATSISFTADEIFINMSGKAAVAGVPAIFDVNPTPEPGTLALLSLSLAALAARRSRKE
jgi:hypothetical protein